MVELGHGGCNDRSTRPTASAVAGKDNGHVRSGWLGEVRLQHHRCLDSARQHHRDHRGCGWQRKQHLVCAPGRWIAVCNCGNDATRAMRRSARRTVSRTWCQSAVRGRQPEGSMAGSHDAELAALAHRGWRHCSGCAKPRWVPHEPRCPGRLPEASRRLLVAGQLPDKHGLHHADNPLRDRCPAHTHPGHKLRQLPDRCRQNETLRVVFRTGCVQSHRFTVR